MCIYRSYYVSFYFQFIFPLPRSSTVVFCSCPAFLIFPPKDISRGERFLTYIFIPVADPQTVGSGSVSKWKAGSGSKGSGSATLIQTNTSVKWIKDRFCLQRERPILPALPGLRAPDLHAIPLLLRVHREAPRQGLTSVMRGRHWSTVKIPKIVWFPKIVTFSQLF